MTDRSAARQARLRSRLGGAEADPGLHVVVDEPGAAAVPPAGDDGSVAADAPQDTVEASQDAAEASEAPVPPDATPQAPEAPEPAAPAAASEEPGAAPSLEPVAEVEVPPAPPAAPAPTSSQPRASTARRLADVGRTVSTIKIPNPIDSSFKRLAIELKDGYGLTTNKQQIVEALLIVHAPSTVEELATLLEEAAARS